MAKRFCRSHDNKVIAGVCGGIAEFFGIDATWVRLGTVVLSLFTIGTGVAVYIVLWLFLPDSSTGDIGLDAVFDFYKAHRDRPSDRV
jgi:phage shock protein PspC (stress-responsive transcriptional regulator)